LTEVASGLQQPVFLTSPPGDDRLFIVEQVGRIRILAGGALREGAFLDLSELVSCCGERGLLGLAFHPQYAENGRFFIDYTDVSGDTVIAEYAASSDPDVAEPDAVRTLLVIDQPFPNHNGGMLAFGPDGLLYVGMGDGGGAGDPRDQAQDPSSKLGKILRIDVDRHPEPPPGNYPGADPDVWAIGLRNPWRFAFDRATGDLVIGDVGQNLFEEIDVAFAGEGGRNYGWPITEAAHCFDPPEGCDTDGLTLPVFEYGRDDGCSVTGGYVYRGSGIPGLVGRYLFGDYCSNRVWSFTLEEGTAGDVVELSDDLDTGALVGGLSSFGEDVSGELYVVSLAGRVFRIDPE
jgi:glucose/arabinose dehydrogenase